MATQDKKIKHFDSNTETNYKYIGPTQEQILKELNKGENNEAYIDDKGCLHIKGDRNRPTFTVTDDCPEMFPKQK